MRTSNCLLTRTPRAVLASARQGQDDALVADGVVDSVSRDLVAGLGSAGATEQTVADLAGRASHTVLGLGVGLGEGVHQVMIVGIGLVVGRQEVHQVLDLIGVITVVPDGVVLDGQLQGVATALDLGLLGPVLHGDVVGDGDGSQDADDHDDDHQLDQGETLAVQHCLFLLETSG